MTASRRVWGVAAVVLVGFAVAPQFALAQRSRALDLLTEANVQIDGAGSFDLAGGSVAGAGDVNGDGRQDVVVGAPQADERGRRDSGSTYVVFGQASLSTVDLAELGSKGFRIDGPGSYCWSGTAVAGAGDVNADGRDDVVVGIRNVNSNGADSGSTYVVFGKASTAPVDLAALGSSGFRIDGAAAGDESGRSVAGAGDVNGDGRADVIVGAPYADRPFDRTSSGVAYVVFGRTSTGTVDLGLLGSGGFRIDGATASDLAGRSVAGAGDVNGDGRADVIVGAPGPHNPYFVTSRSAYVVFGKPDTAPIHLAALGGRGFRISGVVGSLGLGGDAVGASVAGAGDVNGDGRADVIVGAPYADRGRRSDSGFAYVVFGKASTDVVDLTMLGAGGFRIDGARGGDLAGWSVAGAGDMNADGRADVLVGAPAAGSNSRAESGSAYLVFGKASTAAVDLAALGAGGLRIDGAASGDWAGVSVAGAGDVTGDRGASVVVGAWSADNNSRDNSGSAYIVYGPGLRPTLSYGGDIDAYADEEIEPLEPSVRSTGSTAFTVSPPLPEGLVLDAGTGAISGTPVQTQPETFYRVTLADAAGSASAQLAIQVDPDVHFPATRRGCRYQKTDRRLARNLWIRTLEVNQGVSGKHTLTFHSRRWPAPRKRRYDQVTRSPFYDWPSFTAGHPPLVRDDTDAGVTRRATRLIAGKPALVRVYAGARGVRRAVTAVVRLRAFEQLPDGSAGDELAGSPRTVRWRAPSYKTAIRSQRATPKCSFNFLLPTPWLEGKVRLQAEVTARRPGWECEGCVDGANVVKLTDLDFRPAPEVPVGAVRLTWAGDRGPDRPNNITTVADTTRRVYPLAEHGLRVYHHPTPQSIDPPRPDEPSDSTHEWDCAAALRNFQEWVKRRVPGENLPKWADQDDSFASPDMPKYVGFFPHTRRGSESFDGVRGCAWPGAGRVAVTHAYNNDPDLSRSDRLHWAPFAHELAHTFALLHMPDACGLLQSLDECVGWEASPDGFDEGEGAEYGGGSINGYALRGIDTLAQREGRNLSRISTYTAGTTDLHAHDFMSYDCVGGACWVSPNTWRSLSDSMAVYPTRPPPVPPFASPVATTAVHAGARRRARSSLVGSASGLTRVIVTGGGIATNAGGGKPKATLDPFWEVDGPPPPEPPSWWVPEGDYRLVGRDAAGAVVIEHPVDAKRTVDHGRGSSLSFTDVFALPPSAVRVDLMKGDQVLASRVASEHPPTITYVAPRGGARWRTGRRYRVRWRTDDADGDKVRLGCQYRIHPQSAWFPGIGQFTSPKRSYGVRSRAFLPSHRAQFRCDATDGFHTAFVEGPPFRVDAHRLRVSRSAITSAHADSFGGLNFSAFVVDPNTGREVKSYRWYYRNRLVSRRSKFTTFRFRNARVKRGRRGRRTLTLVVRGAYRRKGRRRVTVRLEPCLDLRPVCGTVR